MNLTSVFQLMKMVVGVVMAVMMMMMMMMMTTMMMKTVMMMCMLSLEILKQVLRIQALISNVEGC